MNSYGHGKKAEHKDRHPYIREKILSHGADILDSKKFLSSDANIQHGDVSVLEHSISVAETALKLARGLHLRISERELVRGALLHDYFLYDWHNDGKEAGNIHPKLHGFFHAGTALKNASRDFDLTDKESEIIKKHMWPLTVIPPTNREAWLVTIADKYASLMETVKLHKGGNIRSHYIDLERDKDAL